MEYRATKDLKVSGIEWIGKIPANWQLVKIKYLAKVDPEDLSSSTNPDFQFKYIDIGSVNSTGKVERYQSMTFANSPSRARKIVKVNDVIVSTVRTYLRAVTIIDKSIGDLVCSTGFSVLRPIRVNPTYLFYSIIAKHFIDRVEAYSVGVSYPAISSNAIGNFNIQVPPEEEQKAIASFLDRKTQAIDALIQKKEQLIERLKEKRQALITQSVTKGLDPDVPMKDSGIEWLGEVPEHWNVTKFKFLSTIKRGASPRPIDDPNYFDDNGTYAWVRISDVTSSDIFLEETDQTLSELGASKSVKLNPGELILSIAASVGKPIINKIKCCIHDGFIYFKNLKLNTKYAFYLFASKEPYRGLGKLGTQLNLNSEIVGSIKTPVPTINEQVRIVEFLDQTTLKLNNIIRATEVSAVKLKEYRQSLISAAVTGKIDVRSVSAKAMEDKDEVESNHTVL